MMRIFACLWALLVFLDMTGAVEARQDRIVQAVYTVGFVLAWGIAEVLSELRKRKPA